MVVEIDGEMRCIGLLDVAGTMLVDLNLLIGWVIG
jgi:hypothetical protein